MFILFYRTRTLYPQNVKDYGECGSSEYPTIKFELVYSERYLNVLDLTLHLTDGYIVTDIYAKPTDSHLYLPPSSSHPKHCINAIPFGVALRLRRNCSNDDFLHKRCNEYKSYLRQQGYCAKLVNQQFDKALKLERSHLLKPKQKSSNRTFPLVLDYNPRLPDVSRVIKKHLHLLESNPKIAEIFPAKSIMPAYRRTKNLKDLLAPSKCKDTPISSKEKGCFKCSKRCDLCKNFLVESSNFTSLATGRSYNIQQNLGCSSSNVIYLASCIKCNLQYVGSTSNPFKVRFRNHKSDMLRNKKSCEVAIHFNHTHHSLDDFKFIVIEGIVNIDSNIDRILLQREAYWTAQLYTLHPFGLNKRCEFRSRKRINYQRSQSVNTS